MIAFARRVVLTAEWTHATGFLHTTLGARSVHLAVVSAHWRLCLVFTPSGVDQSTLAYAGEEHCLALVLVNRVYINDGPGDWKVWYFHGDLP